MSCFWSSIGTCTVDLAIMLMLVVFKGDEDSVVSKINEQYWTMLRRLLTKSSHNSLGVESLLYSVKNCLETLPLMARPFLDY